MKTIIVTPAYGRDYKSRKDVLKDWNDNKDFIIQPHRRYVNKQQTGELIEDNYTHISFRYNKLLKVFLLALSLSGCASIEQSLAEHPLMSQVGLALLSHADSHQGDATVLLNSGMQQQYNMQQQFNNNQQQFNNNTSAFQNTLRGLSK